jgi:hypothetical protein
MSSDRRSVGDGTSALKSFREAFNDPSFSDVTFVVQGKRFHSHRAILACRSDVFKAMLFNGSKETFEREIAINDFDADHFEILLEFAYTGQTLMDSSHVLGVLQMANFYGFGDLEEECRSLAINFVDVDNVLPLLDTSMVLNEESVTEKCCNFIAHNAAVIIMLPGWLRISEAAVDKVLRSASLDCSEFRLFNRVVAWVEHALGQDHEKRAECLGHFLPHIRFPLMSVEELLYKVKPLMTSGDIPYCTYIEALEFKLSRAYFEHVLKDSFQPRIPSNLGKIVCDLPMSTLDGWTKIIEENGAVALSTDVSTLCTGFTYIAVGERMVDCAYACVCAVGHVAHATAKTTCVTAATQDGLIFWHNFFPSAFGFAPSARGFLAPMDTTLPEDRKMSWSYGQRGNGNGAIPKIRFVYAK